MIVWPKAATSVLQAGSNHDTVCRTVLKVIERSSALENSISLVIHQEPNISELRGLHGPPDAHGLEEPGRWGMTSSTSPSQCLEGPSPLLQLCRTSFRARRVA